MFKVKKGSRIFAVKTSDIKSPKDFVPKVMNRNAIYDKHHVLIDPVGSLGTYNRANAPFSGVLGEYASMGYYGFTIPAGSGFIGFVVNMRDVEHLD